MLWLMGVYKSTVAESECCAAFQELPCVDGGVDEAARPVSRRQIWRMASSGSNTTGEERWYGWSGFYLPLTLLETHFDHEPPPEYTTNPPSKGLMTDEAF